MKMTCYSRKLALLLLALMVIVSSSSIVNAVNTTKETYIIAPEELEGMEGTLIDTSEIFVQRITFLTVENIKNIEVVDDKGVVIKEFPSGTMKAYVREIGNKTSLGFITLKGTPVEGKVALGKPLTGEFLFYQDGRIFNKLNLAKEGPLYFYRESKNPNTNPLLLLIGTVEDGEFSYEYYVRVTTKTIELRR